MMSNSKLLDVMEKNRWKVLGQLLDIDRTGITLLTQQHLTEKEYFEAVIRLPKSDSFLQKEVEFQANICWIHSLKEKTGNYKAGCIFYHIDPTELRMLTSHSVRRELNLDNKRSSRRSLLFYLDIFDLETRCHIGHLGDISNEGVMLITEKALPKYQLLNIRIKLLDLEEFPRKYIDVMVETRWSRPDANPKFNCVGCLFLNLSQANKLLILVVQDLLGFNEDDISDL